MKKLVLMFAVVCSASLFSCGNKAQEATEEAPEAAVVEEVAEEVVVPTDSVETPAEEAPVAETPAE